MGFQLHKALALMARTAPYIGLRILVYFGLPLPLFSSREPVRESDTASARSLTRTSG
ncbi:MAG TPA: hypothetical protein VFQ34_11520 [Nitrospiraceae bacterium]|nr:hypothetical protein [Nitrospiraceae bacterium]